MDDFSPGEVRPGALHFAGAASGGSAEGALAETALKTAAADRMGRNATARQGRVCSGCELPPGSCQCKKVGRTGRWFRSGTSIVVTARGRSGRTILPNPLKRPMSKTV
jgi:hypothetical protein